MELQGQKERFDELGVFVVAVSQEEKDLRNALDMAAKTRVAFPLVHDVKRESAPWLDRTNGYLIDGDGVVRQVFPMSAYMRPSTELVLDEIERILRPEAAAPAEEAGEGTR